MPILVELSRRCTELKVVEMGLQLDTGWLSEVDGGSEFLSKFGCGSRGQAIEGEFADYGSRGRWAFSTGGAFETETMWPKRWTGASPKGMYRCTKEWILFLETQIEQMYSNEKPF